MLPGLIFERHLPYTPPFRIRAYEDLLQYIEISGSVGVTLYHVRLVQAESARHVAYRQAETDAEQSVQDPAQNEATLRHLRVAAWNVAGGDYHLGRAPAVPQVVNENRPV